MFRKFTITLATAALLLLAVGCGDDNNGGGMTGGGSSSGSIVIDVSAGTTPSYTWPEGDAFSLSVVRQSDPTTIVWGLATPGLNNVLSAVTHGTVQGGTVPTALAGDEEPTLTAGVGYRVSVTRLDGSFGFTDFTP